MKEIKAYQCEYCIKYYKKNKYQVKDHESVCFYNPKNKACQTCVHNSGWNCKVFNKGLVHPKVELVDFEKKVMHLQSDCDKWEENTDDNFEKYYPESEYPEFY